MRPSKSRFVLAILICPSSLSFAQVAHRSRDIAGTLKSTLRVQSGTAASATNGTRIKRPLLAPIDQWTQAPLVRNVRPGSVVELWVGNNRIATSAPVPSGTSLARVRLPHRLSPGETVRAREKSGHVTTQFSNPVVVENNYVTNRYDNERSGWNSHESELTVRRVRKSFDKLCEHPVDDAIRAQPLYVQDVDIPERGRHNVVFVATDGDEVWAFDADSCGPNDQALWVRKLLGPLESIPTGACGGVRGIWATPVIDRTTNTLYVVAPVQNSANTFFRLHALNIATGQDQDRTTPSVLDGMTVNFSFGGTTASFNALAQNNRPGLLWDRGVLYLAFGSSCDIGVYHGWVVAYDADVPGSSTFFSQLGVFNTSPTVNTPCSQDVSPPCMAGVWQSGLGLAADGDGIIYFMTGNGQFDPSKGSYGDTVLGLKLPASPSTQMQIVSYFTPFDFDTLYNPGDKDLGSGGPVLFENGSRRFLLAGGKPFKSYLIDRDCQPVASCSGDPTWCRPAPGQVCTSDNPNVVLQTLTQPHGMVAGPAYYRGPSDLRIFYGFNFNPMAAYEFLANPPQIVNPETTPDSAPVTSPIPTISSHGNAHGSAILWAVFHPATGQDLTLHAYDANDLQDNLFALRGSSLDVGGWVPLGNHYGNSFQVPTVIHGKVYAGSKDRLVVFALKKRPHCVSSVECNDTVSFRCVKDSDSDEFQLQQKQDGVWKTLTDPGSPKLLGKFAYLWDYSAGDAASYRVCSKDQPESCTQEFTAALPHMQCSSLGEKGPSRQCGRKGKPPCFLEQPWPVSSREKTEGPGPNRD
jgi:hypothetical protein